MNTLILALLLSCAKPTKIEGFLAQTHFDKQQIASRAAAVGILTKDHVLIGSGAYIKHKKRLYVVTAAHVVKDEEEIKIGAGPQIVSAKVIKTIPEKDAALLVLEEKLLIKPAKVQKHLSAEKLLGQDLCYTGFPNGAGPVTLCGEVAGALPPFHMLHSYVWFGSSGSAITNTKGEIVGIVSAIDVCVRTGMPIEDSGYFVEISQEDLF